MLRNAPRPSTPVVAGAAAALTGAATLADPNGQAARTAEATKPEDHPRELAPGPSVPADVLDRLDQGKQGPATAEPPKQPAQPAKPTKPIKTTKNPPNLWVPPDCDHEPLSKRCPH